MQVSLALFALATPVAALLHATPSTIRASTLPQMGLLDNHPVLQKGTRATLKVGTTAFVGAAIGELLSIHLSALACAVAPIAPLPVATAFLGAIVPVTRSLFKTNASDRGCHLLGNLDAIKDASAVQHGDASLQARAVRLERSALEMELEQEGRFLIAAERKDALTAAERSLWSAEAWASRVHDARSVKQYLGEVKVAEDITAWDARVALADAEVSNAAERVRRVQEQIASDELLVFEMEAMVLAAQARAIEARVDERAARPGFFSVARAHAEDLNAPDTEDEIDGVAGA